MTDSPVVDQFAEQVEAVSGLVHRGGSMGRAFALAVDICADGGGRLLAAVGWDSGSLEVIAGLCREKGLGLISENLRAKAGDIHTALTPVDFGAAATGSLVLDSSSEDLRLATMLSEVHVAVLDTGNIRPDLESLEPELTGLMAGGPNYLAFITGASRTADIERVLTIGVHGPAELHVILVEEAG